MFLDKCPLCGTSGREWHKEPQVFACPNCSTLFSRFGLLLEPREDPDEMWS